LKSFNSGSARFVFFAFLYCITVRAEQLKVFNIFATPCKRRI